MRVLRAEEGKLFAFKDEEGKEIVVGKEIYLGINDNGERYYEIDESKDEEIIEEENKEEEN